MRLRSGIALGLAITLVVGCGTAQPTLTPSVARTGAPTAAPSAPGAPTPGASAAAGGGPTLGAWHALVEMEGSDGIMLVNGGPESGHPADAPLELWTWEEGAWSPVPVQGEWPGWRNFAAVAWDEGRRALIVHGGLQARGDQFAETWEWRNGSWTLAHAGGPEAPGPGFREGSAMAWDPDSGASILVAGAGTDGIHGDTWAWDGSAWEQLAPDGAGPSPRFPGLLEPDVIGGGLLLYGGHVLDGPAISVADTWRWTTTGWEQLIDESPPGGRVNTGSAWAESLGRLVLVGGGHDDETAGDVWGWDGAVWSEISPDAFPPRQAHGLAYDARTGRILLSGGLDAPGTSARYSDLWAWDGEGRAAEVWTAGE